MDSSTEMATLIDLIIHKGDIKEIEAALVKVHTIHEKDEASLTPLYYAVTTNTSVEVVNTLMKAGASVDFSYLTESVIHNKNPEIVVELYHHLFPLTINELDYLFLLVASHRIDYSLLHFFVKEGANIDSCLGIDLYPDWEDELDLSDEEKSLYLVRQNAIVLALYENPSPIKMIQELIKIGVNVNFIDSVGNSVLTHSLDDITLLKILIEEGNADIHVTDSIGKTPLMSACEGENIEVALYLIEKEDDMNRVSKEGKTALHYALCCHLCNNYSVVIALINHGADINRVDGEGKSPLDIALEHFAHTKIIRLIERNL